jgi:FkbM family methyltransferase
MEYKKFHGQFSTPVDKIIRDYFPNQEYGVCIEVGAVDGIEYSNTYHFEKNGWDVLCVEPIPSHYNNLIINRKNCLNYAISDKNIDEVEFTSVVLKDNTKTAVSGLKTDERLFEQLQKLGHKPIKEKIKVTSKRLDWCIENYFNHPKIDFLSIDTEGTELDVLNSLDLNKYGLQLLVVENNFNDLEIELFLNSKGWIKDKRVEVNDFYIKKIL